MTVEQPLIVHFKNYIPLNEEERNLFDKRVTQRKIKRKQMILQEGMVCKFYSFVVEGCLSGPITNLTD
jgi:CRP-like cAMP-binding protein